MISYFLTKVVYSVPWSLFSIDILYKNSLWSPSLRNATAEC